MSQSKSTECLCVRCDAVRRFIRGYRGDATGCNPQLILDGVADILAREAVQPSAAEVIAEAKKALEMCKLLIQTEWFVSDVPANESPALECDACTSAIQAIAAWEAAQK